MKLPSHVWWWLHGSRYFNPDRIHLALPLDGCSQICTRLRSKSGTYVPELPKPENMHLYQYNICKKNIRDNAYLLGSSILQFPHNDQHVEPVHKVSISISIMTLLVDVTFVSISDMLEDSEAVAL